MKEPIIIEDLRANVAIEKFAEILKVPSEKETPDAGFDIPQKVGNGYIHGYTFTHGIDTLIFRTLLNSPLKLVYKNPMVCPLRFIYNVSGSLKLDIEGQTSNSLNLEPSHFLILSTSTEYNHTLKFGPKTDSTVLIIDIYRKDFEEKIEQFLKFMDKELVNIFRDLNGILKFEYLSTYHKKIAILIEELLDSDHEDFMKSVFVEGKTQEILANTIQTYLDTKSGKGFYLNEAYLKKIEQAENIIKEDLEKIPSISNIAKIVGINQSKLQEGFKHIHKCSVHVFIRNLKMAKARELLESTNMNITEVSERIGINSKSYFSKLFKEYYGVSPKNYQVRFQEERANKSA